MGKGGEMNAGKGDESGGYENPNYPVVVSALTALAREQHYLLLRS